MLDFYTLLGFIKYWKLFEYYPVWVHESNKFLQAFSDLEYYKHIQNYLTILRFKGPIWSELNLFLTQYELLISFILDTNKYHNDSYFEFFNCDSYLIKDLFYEYTCKSLYKSNSIFDYQKLYLFDFKSSLCWEYEDFGKRLEEITMPDIVSFEFLVDYRTNRFPLCFLTDMEDFRHYYTPLVNRISILWLISTS